MKNKVKAILFDLDDTLLENANETFLPAYFKVLTEKLGRLISPDEFLNHLIYATQRVIANTDPSLTNREVFWDSFLSVADASVDEVRPVLEDFYANDFPELRRLTRRLPEARAVVQQAFDQGYEVAIATNPLYPRQAIVHRLVWAGVADFPYALITSYENMHFAKPQPSYYAEIADRIEIAPEACLMVGDDLENDIQPAAEVGMHTFWIIDEADHSHQADWAGTLGDVERLITAP